MSRCGVSRGSRKAAARVTTPRIPAQETRVACAQAQARAPQRGRSEVVEGCRAEDPHDARDDRRDEDGDADEHHAGRPELVVRGERDDVGQLQPDEKEHRVLEQERDGSPVGLLGHPRGRRLQQRRLVPEQQPGHDDREHAAGMDRLGGEVGEEGRDERQRRVQYRVLDVATHDREHVATASPTRSPPPTASAKSPRTCHTPTVAVMAMIAVRSVTRAVASLTRLSPSRIETIRRGMPTRRAIVVAATASGGATIAPRASAAASCSPGIE